MLIELATSSLGLGDGSTPDVPFVRIFLALILGVLLVFAAVWWFRRSGQFGGVLQVAKVLGAERDRISVLATKRVRSGWDAAIIKCDEQEYFVLLSAGQATVLCANNRSGQKLADRAETGE